MAICPKGSLVGWRDYLTFPDLPNKREPPHCEKLVRKPGRGRKLSPPSLQFFSKFEQRDKHVFKIANDVKLDTRLNGLPVTADKHSGRKNESTRWLLLFVLSGYSYHAICLASAVNIILQIRLEAKASRSRFGINTMSFRR